MFDAGGRVAGSCTDQDVDVVPVRSYGFEEEAVSLAYLFKDLFEEFYALFFSKSGFFLYFRRKTM